MRRAAVAFAFLAAAILPAIPAHAQFNGSNLLGDFGVGSGTQPAPGLYVATFYYRYYSDTIKDSSGKNLIHSADAPPNATINALVPMVWYVSKFKILGANYGFIADVPLVDNALQAPVFNFDQKTGVHLGDMYIRPLDLGWHTRRADYVAGFSLFAPAGKFKWGNTNNTGLGMWSYELFGGTTVHLDSKKSLNFATTAYWETHSKKRDTDIKVGQILTLEGGLGKSYLNNSLTFGAAYYAQWKLTADTPSIYPLDNGGTIDLSQMKHRVYGLGPDVTVPLASKSKLFGFLNVRYFWEMVARTKSQGQGLVVSVTFPIPSIKIK